MVSPEERLFNRYTLKRVIGRGGMGIVWLAHDEELMRNVAMKFLPDMIVQNREAVEDLKRETRRSLDLTHHHIVRIYDFTQDDSSAAIIMEYVDGESLSTLKTLQPGGCFGVSTIQTWAGHFCLAMDYAHRQARIVHRDLKPANLMVNGRGELKVTDFGISRSMSDSMTRVSMSNSAGTLAYMSPEQALGSPPATADDVYAFGATIYDLLTGKPPFFRGNIQVQLETVTPPAMTKRRTELGTSAEPIPRIWEETIAACLSKRPEDRPLNMSEIGSLLGVGSGTTSGSGFQLRQQTTEPVAGLSSGFSPPPGTERGGAEQDAGATLPAQNASPPVGPTREEEILSNTALTPAPGTPATFWSNQDGPSNDRGIDSDVESGDTGTSSPGAVANTSSAAELSQPHGIENSPEIPVVEDCSRMESSGVAQDHHPKRNALNLALAGIGGAIVATGLVLFLVPDLLTRPAKDSAAENNPPPEPPEPPPAPPRSEAEMLLFKTPTHYWVHEFGNAKEAVSEAPESGASESETTTRTNEIDAAIARQEGEADKKAVVTQLEAALLRTDPQSARAVLETLPAGLIDDPEIKKLKTQVEKQEELLAAATAPNPNGSTSNDSHGERVASSPGTSSGRTQSNGSHDRQGNVGGSTNRTNKVNTVAKATPIPLRIKQPGKKNPSKIDWTHHRSHNIF